MYIIRRFAACVGIFICDCLFVALDKKTHWYFHAVSPGFSGLSENLQSTWSPSVSITLMARVDYFGLHRCRPAAFTQQVCSGIGDMGTGSGPETRACITQVHGFCALATANSCGSAWEPMLMCDTGTGTHASYYTTDTHGFPCTSLSHLTYIMATEYKNSSGDEIANVN